MSRSSRLLDLLQVLRRHRRPVTAAALAAELGVSIRTVYRDITTLVGQGATIQGEAGLGYVLRPGYLLPPLMFGEDEIEALVLGLRLAARHGDDGLARAAEDAAAKIAAVLPTELRDLARTSGLLAGPSKESAASEVDLAPVRHAIRRENKLRVSYTDARGKRSDRVVWPIAIGFFDQGRVVAAWCEARSDFRHFRADRIVAAEPLPDRYPRRRTSLLRAWREKEGIADPVQVVAADAF